MRKTGRATPAAPNHARSYCDGAQTPTPRSEGGYKDTESYLGRLSWRGERRGRLRRWQRPVPPPWKLTPVCRCSSCARGRWRPSPVRVGHGPTSVHTPRNTAHRNVCWEEQGVRKMRTRGLCDGVYLNCFLFRAPLVAPRPSSSTTTVSCSGRGDAVP